MSELDHVADVRPSEEIVPLQLALVDVLRDPSLDDGARRIATTRLLALARATPWPELACEALLRVLGWEAEGRIEHVDPVNVRLTEMLRRRELTCSRCLRPLPDERYLELERFRAEAAPWDRRLREQVVVS
ncbi:MAG: hypothetical protein ACR2L4_00680 [Actinomycetota bacterium]